MKKKQHNTQREHRQGIDVGPGMNQVSSAHYWYQAGHFANEDEARGAFKLAYQQALDGMGRTNAEWMGITHAEYDEWMRSDALPKRRGRRLSATRPTASEAHPPPKTARKAASR
jgi:hypothetical protein